MMDSTEQVYNKTTTTKSMSKYECHNVLKYILFGLTFSLMVHLAEELLLDSSHNPKNDSFQLYKVFFWFGLTFCPLGLVATMYENFILTLIFLTAQSITTIYALFHLTALGSNTTVHDYVYVGLHLGTVSTGYSFVFGIVNVVRRETKMSNVRHTSDVEGADDMAATSNLLAAQQQQTIRMYSKNTPDSKTIDSKKFKEVKLETELSL